MVLAARPHVLRPIVAAGLILCATTHAGAQGRIRGIVVDRDSEPIAGATVTAEELGSSATSTAATDESGRFSFLGLNRGEWTFIVRADGFEPVQGMAVVRASGPGTAVQFTMERDLFNPPPPAGGVLGGVRATAVIEDLEQADRLFDAGDYGAAIEAYEAVLASAPALTSLHLQIGHAHQGLQDPDQAVAAYRAALAADPTNAEARAALDSAGPVTR
jgi:hypothetical protein